MMKCVGNAVDKTDFTPDTRRAWHAPALKTLAVTNTLANENPGPTFDSTYSVLDS
jgi:hypothetical protein